MLQDRSTAVSMFLLIALVEAAWSEEFVVKGRVVDDGVDRDSHLFREGKIAVGR